MRVDQLLQRLVAYEHPGFEFGLDERVMVATGMVVMCPEPAGNKQSGQRLTCMADPRRPTIPILRPPSPLWHEDVARRLLPKGWAWEDGTPREIDHEDATGFVARAQGPDGGDIHGRGGTREAALCACAIKVRHQGGST